MLLLCVFFDFLSLFGLLFSKLNRNSEDPDQISHYAVSDLGMDCLPMSHKKDKKLTWVERDTDLLHQGILYLLTMLPITSTRNWHV